MEYRKLGKTGILASRLCFGTLTFSSLQKNMQDEQSVALMKYAFSKGVNILDTAELYDNYFAIGKAVNEWGREKIHIVTKSYAHDKNSAKLSLDKARREMKCDYIDVFMLHEQESEHTLRGHYEAVEYFLNMKEKGIIKAFGISTHFISGVKAAADCGYIDVIHPIFNMHGLGIVDGDLDQMYNAIDLSWVNDIGIIGMKALGGGHLMKNASMALDYALSCRFMDSIAIGMQSEAEIDFNTAFFEGSRNIAAIENSDKKLFIHDWCTGCGKCARRCAQGAITIVNNRALVDDFKCILCGYCARECVDFCIKVL